MTRYLSRIGAVLGSALPAALVCGLSLRLIMRAMILAFPIDQPHFTLGGTMFVMVTGILPTLPLALLYAAVERRLPGRPWAKGLLFGALFAAVVGVPLLIVDPGELLLFDRQRFGVPGLTGLTLFALMFMLIGTMVGWGHHRLTPWIARHPRASTAVGLVLVAPFAFGCLFLASTVVSTVWKGLGGI